MSDLHTKERVLTSEIAPAVEQHVPGIEVLAVELLSPSRFCVYVDHPQGVDHALCARVTSLLDRYRGTYTIDVSSPGPERPLRTRAHFRSVTGRTVQIRTAAPVGGRKRLRGAVVAAGDRSVRIEQGEQALEVPYEEIVRGNLIDEKRVEP